ncbi:hypothetical protein G6O69_15880 [Pseudenhygromyxa sp. WMMC2535]|uniref:methyl-accepting chemotaxis protein n=1 Tax=Pseudenhygromyxa sp. WMMC2535 TaxID=2712867 RepID=UPI001595EFB2|nr:methyl-accepting chemotaxis protein [Pseudenhygromyxa sp. WMMC2535]NVB39323.1 hypothetical protein [Pseudenhygromyxa sp. WMMC2535]
MTKLGKHTVVTVINVAGEAVEFVLDRTVALGKLMWQLLESLGAKLLKLLEFLIDLLPWKAIAQTQKQLLEVLEGGLAQLAEGDMSKIEAALDKGLARVGDEAGDALDALTRKLGGKVHTGKGVAEVGTEVSKVAKGVAKEVGKVSDKVMGWLSKPLEYINWLLSKLFSKIPLVDQIAKVMAKAAKRLGKVIAELGEAMVAAGKVLPEGLGAAITNIAAIAKKPAQAPVLLASARTSWSRASSTWGWACCAGSSASSLGRSRRLPSSPSRSALSTSSPARRRRATRSSSTSTILSLAARPPSSPCSPGCWRSPSRSCTSRPSASGPTIACKPSGAGSPMPRRPGCGRPGSAPRSSCCAAVRDAGRRRRRSTGPGGRAAIPSSRGQ